MNELSIVALDLGKALLVPSKLLIISLAICVLLLWSQYKRFGRWLTTITAAILLVVTILPAASWLARPLEMRFPKTRQLPDSVAGVIVLGGAFKSNPSPDWDQPQVNSHAERLTAFMALAHQYPNLKLVFSGGASIDDHKTESDMARALFGSVGMDTNRIVF